MIEINWEAFTPWMSLGGGIMIGVSAVMMALLAGRIAGISGIVGALTNPQTGDVLWRIMFLVGMFAAPWIYIAIFGSFEFESPRGPFALVIAGLLVGIGTRMGSGCTSGHGVCGLSRMSPRSIAATLTFMAVGFAVASLIMGVLA